MRCAIPLGWCTCNEISQDRSLSLYKLSCPASRACGGQRRFKGTLEASVTLFFCSTSLPLHSFNSFLYLLSALFFKMRYNMPYIFEDKTGKIYTTEFHDVNDRMSLAVSSSAAPGRAQGAMTLKIFELRSRSNALTMTSSSSHDPGVILDFGPGGSLGTVLFVSQSVSMAMVDWIYKSSRKEKCVHTFIPQLSMWHHRRKAFARVYHFWLHHIPSIPALITLCPDP